MYLIVFIYGIIIGSFLNVCIWRIPRGESIRFPSSHCPKCSKPLKFYDLFPVLSYLITGGKCRYCNNEISLQYPLIELINGSLYLLIFHIFGPSLILIEYCLMASLLLTISVIDYQHQIIPDGLVITGFVILFLFNITKYIDAPGVILTGLMGFLIAGGFFLLLAIVTKGGMGGGDIKLMALLGFWLGWRWILMVMMISFILGGIISILLIALKIKGKKDTISFGPFISLATLMTVLFGSDIINYYISIFINRI